MADTSHFHHHGDPTGLGPSIGFCIDNTGSESSEANSIRTFAHQVIDHVVAEAQQVPTWHLLTFNDNGDKRGMRNHVKLLTSKGGDKDQVAVKQKIDAIRFSGGGDSPERAAYGMSYLLNFMPHHSVMFVLTDNKSKNLEKEASIKKICEEKEIAIFVILCPSYRSPGVRGDDSWQFYDRISHHGIMNMEDAHVDEILAKIKSHMAGAFTYFFLEDGGEFLTSNIEFGFDDGYVELQMKGGNPPALKKQMWRFDAEHNELVNKLGHVAHVEYESKDPGARVRVKRTSGRLVHEKHVWDEKRVATHPDHHPSLWHTTESTFRRGEEVTEVIIWNKKEESCHFNWVIVH